jgi:biotin operon repressor
MLYNILMKKYKKKPWSDAERKVLLTNYNYVDKEKLAEYLPGRSPTAITSQAWQLRNRGLIFK